MIKHIFSKKALKYRAVAFCYVLAASWFWTGDVFKSIELTLTIVLGKMLIYGIVEWREHDRRLEI